jgi:single-strand DNA-binding protein
MSDVPHHHNLAVLSGVVTSEPERRELPSGSVVVAFDVTTTGPEGTGRTSVPCAWIDPRDPEILGAGVDVVVAGSIRRRFFRAGGATASRTEVVVDRVLPSRRSRGVERLVARACAELSRLGGAPGR